MISEWLARLFGCFASRNYDIPTVLRIRATSIAEREQSLTLVYQVEIDDTGEDNRHNVTSENEQRSVELDTMYLLCTDATAYARAVQSLKDFLRTRRPFYVQYVSASDNLRKVLTDVEEFIDDLTPEATNDASQEAMKSRRRYRANFGNNFTPELMLRDDDNLTHFTFSVIHGPIYWIPTLRTGQRGNRFPKDERFASVVQHKTLDTLLKNKL